jgi:hypothetical protein
MTERRREERQVVPELYREYITFKIREGGGEFVPAELQDFSPKGIRIKVPHGLPIDSTIECLIAAPKSLTKEIALTAKIKYWIKDERAGDYLVGAEIVQTDDPIWFNLFSNVHDFIKERMGSLF